MRFNPITRLAPLGLMALTMMIPAPLPAAELDAPAVLAGIQGWLDGTRDLSGRFVQQLDSGALGSGPVESGRLYLRRPGAMRWEYEEPEKKLALVSGRKTTLYLEEDHEVLLGRLDGEGELLPKLLLGEGNLSEMFEADLLATPERGGQGEYRIRLSPRTPGETVEEVILTVRASKFAIERAEVLDSLGNRVVYGFVALKRNRGIPADLFVFEPPAGVTITGSH